MIQKIPTTYLLRKQWLLRIDKVSVHFRIFKSVDMANGTYQVSAKTNKDTDEDTVT